MGHRNGEHQMAWCHECEKNSYRSEKAAQRVANHRMSQEYINLRVYYSPSCASFHLTSKALSEVAA